MLETAAPLEQDVIATRAGFLDGAGECAARLRAIDWAASSLGPEADWSQSLKTTIRLMLHSRYAMWLLWGPEKTFFCNDAYMPTVGVKRDWVLGARSDKVWEEIWEDIWPLIQQVLNGGDATWDEALLLFLQRSGYVEETYHTFSYSPVHDDDDGVVRGMLCVVTEVTDRVITERRLAYLGQLGAMLATVTSREEVASAFGKCLPLAAHDIPYAGLYQLDGTCATATLEAVSSRDELFHNFPQQLQPNDSLFGYQPLLDQEPLQVVEALRDRGIEFPKGPWQRSPDAVALLPLLHSGNRLPSGFIAFALNPFRPFDDACRRFLELIASQVAAAFTRAAVHFEEHKRTEALAELNRSKTEFLANVSHELRTPLTLILGPLEQIMRAPQALSPQVSEEINAAHRNSMRLLKLVNSLLDFSRIEAGRLQPELVPVRLARLTADLASLFRSVIERAGLALRVDCQPENEWVQVDADLWEKVMLNLLSNAVKNTYAGTIDVTTRVTDTHFECRVVDTGIGIPSDALPRIFERFYRVPGLQSRSHEGSGIGLSLVSELMRLHNGSVEVQSQLGRGTTVLLTLPRTTPSQQTAPQLTINPDVTDAKPSNANLQRSFVVEARQWLATPGSPLDRSVAPQTADTPQGSERPVVLLVEDNADMRDYISRLLQRDYRIINASDGAEALEQLATPTLIPDLILTDIMMPRMDGIELLKRIRALQTLSDVPVIFISARAGEESRAAGLTEGPDDYLVKPFTAAEILSRVRTHLQLARGRRESHRRLAETAGHAQTALEIGELGTWIWHLRSDAITADARCRKILGVPADAPLTFQQICEQVHGEEIERLRAAIERALERGGDGELAEELRVVAQDRTLRWVRVRGRALGPNTFAAFDRMVGTVRDVTERNRVYNELRDADRRKDLFLATLAHELRNPLAPLRSAARLLQEASLPAERLHWCADVIGRQVQQMSGLLDDLLDVSRVSVGRLVLKKQRVPLAGILDTAIEAARPLIDRHAHRLEVEVSDKGLLVNVDPLRIAQILTNLLTNAAKYTCPGGVIRLSTQITGGCLEMRVRDTGIGLAAHETAVVFEMFAQVESARERAQGGLGIGLALVKGLVLLHDGEVFVHSDGIGKGCEFVVRLPCLGTSTQAEPARPKDDELSGHQRQIKVLIADDNRDAADANAILLRLLGCDVQTAYDGNADVQACVAWRPDVAVLDIGMPGLDGFGVARALRADPHTAATRLIAVTGWGQEENKRATAEAGFSTHLTKPVDPDVLARLVLA